MDEYDDLILRGDAITAIKEFRLGHGCSLVAAKYYIEQRMCTLANNGAFQHQRKLLQSGNNIEKQ